MECEPARRVQITVLADTARTGDAAALVYAGRTRDISPPVPPVPLAAPCGLCDTMDFPYQLRARVETPLSKSPCLHFASAEESARQAAAPRPV
jgi:hypothetical protein